MPGSQVGMKLTEAFRPALGSLEREQEVQRRGGAYAHTGVSSISSRIFCCLQLVGKPSSEAPRRGCSMLFSPPARGIFAQP